MGAFFLGLFALIGIGLAKVPEATTRGIRYVAVNAVNWVVSFWQYLGGL